MGGHRAEGAFLRWRDSDTCARACVCEGQRANKEKMGERRGEVKTPAKERWVLVQLQF